MIKKKEHKPALPIEIDLTGPEGNAFVLLSIAKRLCRKLGYDRDREERIIEEMTLTDYEGLLHTFDREFGMLVTMYR